MKKFLPARLKTAKKQPAVEEQLKSPEQVTTDTVSKHRAEVLNKGRKFKYPFQHSKHRVAITSVAVVVASLLILSLITSYQLYKRQSTSDFTSQVTRIIPFPVAKVDGNYTSYESYLFELRPSLYWLGQYGTTDLKSPDGKRQIDHYKKVSLDRAMTNTIAKDLAKQNNITVEESEVDEAVGRVEALGGNLDQVIAEAYNYNVKDFRRLKRDAILRLKVAKALDKTAPKKAQKVVDEIKAGKTFEDAAKEHSDDLESKLLGGDLGVVEKGKAKLRGEVSVAAFSLQPGQVSEVIETENGDYYIIKVTEKPNATNVKLSIIQIKVKDVDQYLKEYDKAGKIKRYIKTTKDD